MEVKKHNHNLISIKGDINQSLFYKLLINIPDIDEFYFKVSHREYNIEDFDFKDIDEFKLIKLKNDYIENSKILYWGFNEFQFFSFVVVIGESVSNEINFFEKFSAIDLVKKINSFVFFKSVEADVLWIAKSNDLEFPVSLKLNSFGK